MDSIDFKSIPKTPYPTGTYVILHHGVLPPEGLVLSNIKTVPGWPNPVLETARVEGAPAPWLSVIDKLAHNRNERPDFNMGVYQAVGKTLPAALYGPLEHAHPLQAIRFREHMALFPDKYQHLAHLF